MGNTILEALNVRVVGSGDRILVFAHGTGTDQSVWQRILPYFTPNYRVILYDLVCAGSVNPDHFDFRRYSTLDAFVDDLLSILEALSVKSCFYVDHSVSGVGSEAASQREAFLERQGEPHGADAERRHRLDGGDSRAVPQRVSAELGVNLIN